MAKIDESREFVPVNIAVLTVSDTRSEKDDTSGQTLADLASGAGHNVVKRAIVADDRDAIVAKLEE